MNNFKVLPAIFLFFISVESFCQLPLFDKQMQISFDEKQGQFVALDTKLVNEKGDTVLLKDVLDKPAILNLVYYECAGTCSPLMFGVSHFIDEMDLVAGKDYEVITISFDPTEKIDLGIKKKEAYISTMKNKDAAKDWHFFVSELMLQYPRRKPKIQQYGSHTKQFRARSSRQTHKYMCLNI